MDCETCKGCQYYKSYYHGLGVGSVMFSHRCWWTGRDPANMQPSECRKLDESSDQAYNDRKEMTP